MTVNETAPKLACLQDSRELYALQRVLYQQSPNVVLEIGTYMGGSLLTLCTAAANDALVISIDLPGGSFGGGYPAENLALYKTFAQRGQELRLLQVDSHKAETRWEIRNILAGRKVDFLFLDGDHTYDGVSYDFNDYLPFMSNRGIIALHDICEHDLPSVGVPRFWTELKRKYEFTEEFIDHPDKGWGGIGVVYL